MKHSINIVLALSMLLSLFAQSPQVTAQTYTFLEPLPALGGGLSGERAGLFGRYAKNAFNVSIGAAGILAVLMIVVAGVQYTLSYANESQKTDARSRINAAIAGLLIVISAYLVLYTINPDLVSLGLNVPCVTAPTFSPPNCPS